MEITTLPFDGKFQSGLLYLLITDYEFLRNSIEDLNQKHFDAGETHIKLFKLIKLVFEKTKKPLSLNIIKNSILQLQLRGTYSEGDAFGMTNILDAGKLMTPSEYEFIRENCYNFLKKQTMALAYAESLTYYEKGDYDELYSIIGKAYKKSFGIETSLGTNYLNDSVHDRYSEPPRTGIWSTGFERLDSFIDGGMAKKECYTILAPTGRGKCNRINTLVIMSDGTIKKVQDVVVGDKLMGPDGKGRNVLSITSGEDDMYTITPTKGDPYTVNSVHLLSLKATTSKDTLYLADGQCIKPGEKKPIFIEAQHFFNSNKTVKHCLKGWRPEAVSFENESLDHPIPPYILGIWLGDGTSANSEITQLDNAVAKEFIEYSKSIGSPCVKQNTNSKAFIFKIPNYPKRNKFSSCLRELGLLNNKHIPNSYKMTTQEARLELLAGLLDTDGSLHYSGYDFVQNNKQLAEDVVFIARSLGFAANISECEKGIKSTGFTGTYYRVTISGDCDRIPVRLSYKKAKPRKQKKNHLLTGITIEKAGRDKYYGFELDGDKQYLLGDWQVTHNTSLLCNFAVSAIKQKLKVLFITLEMSERQICQRFDAIISGFSPSELASLPEARVELQRRITEDLYGSMPFVKGFDRGKLTVAGLKTYLERFSMENGTPEVVILDWFGCLKLPTNTEKKHEALAEVADEIINMSREFNCSILGAHQTNRGAVGSDIFGYDKVSESFSSLFGMDAVFALGASDKAKDAGKRTLSIAKNRMGPDSVYVNLMGNKPNEPLTFKFTEVPSEEEETSLLYPDSESDKNSD
jgi:replicative DNA helicase